MQLIDNNNVAERKALNPDFYILYSACKNELLQATLHLNPFIP